MDLIYAKKTMNLVMITCAVLFMTCRGFPTPKIDPSDSKRNQVEDTFDLSSKSAIVSYIHTFQIFTFYF